MTCYGRGGTTQWVQEFYETRSRDAGRRATELRHLGYRVSVSPLGPQMTRVGRVTMTLVNIRPPAGNTEIGELPDVDMETL